jgi:hypothetical protein
MLVKGKRTTFLITLAAFAHSNQLSFWNFPRLLPDRATISNRDGQPTGPILALARAAAVGRRKRLGVERSSPAPFSVLSR